ncbi:MAG TPA: helix-turn-helix domain-containing protein [Mycobacteriales bacterium]|nr:helix-turn-helix domain-containing protein [Mycobacteriales bacterium]
MTAPAVSPNQPDLFRSRAEALLSRPTVPVDIAAELLGISRASAFRAVHNGELPAIRLGRRIVIPTARLRALLGLDD